MKSKDKEITKRSYCFFSQTEKALKKLDVELTSFTLKVVCK